MRKIEQLVWITLFSLSFLGFFTQVFAQTKAQEEVLAFEKERANATLTANVEKLKQMLAEEVVWIHSSGKKDNKATYIQNIAEGKARYKTMFVEQSEARVYGNIAVTNGILQFESIATDETISKVRTVFTCVYRRQKGKWRVVSWQTTRL